MHPDDPDHGTLCRLLAKLEPGYLPADIFHAIARLVVLPTYILMPFHERDGQLFVLLHRREATDRYYPSRLDVPGTVVRASDASLAVAHDRLVAAELPGVTIRRGPVFVEVVHERIRRGMEISLIHWIEIVPPPPAELLFDVDRLPGDLVPTEYDRIARAVDHYRGHGR